MSRNEEPGAMPDDVFPGRIVATIEARMGSTRLPGKVLKKAVGKPMLALMVERAMRSRYVDEVVVATTTNSADDAIVDCCEHLGIRSFRGSEDDVLGRVVDAQKAFGAATCVLLTGDCPLIDPIVIDHVVCAFLEAWPHVAYASNCEIRSYPHGLDLQVLRYDTLSETAQIAQAPEFREHVGWYVRRHPEHYPRVDVVAPPGLSNPFLRITLDTPEDYIRIRSVFEGLYPGNPAFTTAAILAYVKDMALG